MATIAKVLIQSKEAENAETTQYISTNCTTMIDKFTAMNKSGATATITVSLVASGGSAGTANKIVTVSILAGKTYTFPEIVGHSLDPGDFVSTLAGTASAINIRMSGRQIT
jgi:hypothetical protein